MSDLHKTPSLPRILAAICYDLLILIGLFMVVGFAVLPVYKYFTGLEAIGADETFFQFFLVTIAFLYYALSWIIGGQTIGMKAWRLVLIANPPNTNITWGQAALRFITAIFSASIFLLGYLYRYVDSDNRMLHDIVSKTHLRYYPKK